MKKIFLFLSIFLFFGCSTVLTGLQGVSEIICPSAKFNVGDKVCFGGFQDSSGRIREVNCNSKDSCSCSYSYYVSGMDEMQEWELKICN